jgi:phosphatidylglycerophosphatase A
VIGSGFGSGYFPIAPGTVGSLVGVVIHLALSGLGLISAGKPLVWAAVLAALFAAGVAASRRCEANWGTDNKKIVIDEIWGMMISLFLLPVSALYVVLGFFIFRILDIVKPFPARQVERVHGGWGVMLDDGMSGVYTCLILHAVRALTG